MAEWQGFYTTAQVARLARIPTRTLYQWKKEGIAKPSVHVMANGNELIDGYSYADLAIIKILRALLDRQLNMYSAATALRHLWDFLGPPSKGWADAHVYIYGNHIFAERQGDWPPTVATRFGQTVQESLFGDLFPVLREQEEEGSLLVPTDFQSAVEINPEIMGGQPVVRGTRVPTSILAMLKKQGKTVAELAKLYFPIPAASIEKAVEYEEFLDRRPA